MNAIETLISAALKDKFLSTMSCYEGWDLSFSKNQWKISKGSSWMLFNDFHPHSYVEAILFIERVERAE